jgi:O-antigen/teichoic acid export membrane protein
MTASGSSEQHADDAIRGLFGRDSIYVVLWSVQIALAALLTPVVTRLLGPQQFGLVASAVAVTQVLFTVGGYGLQTGIQRAYARTDGEQRSRRLVAFGLILGVATWALFYGTGALWAPAIGFESFVPPVQYAVSWAALSAMTGVALGLVRSRDQLGWFAAVTLLQSVFAELLALGLVIFVDRTASSYVLGQMLGQAAALVAAIIAARPRLPLHTDRLLLRGTLRYSLPLVPAALAAYVMDGSDRLVIHADLGVDQVGRYSVARNIGGFTMILLAVLNTMWLPRLFAMKDRLVQDDVLARSRDAIVGLVVAGMVALTMASPLLLALWVPPSYDPEDLLLVTALGAISALPMAGVQMASQVLLLRNRTLPIAVAALVAAVVNLGLNLALVPTLGIEGAATVTFCCYGLQLLIVQCVASSIASVPQPSARFVVLVLGGAVASLGSAWLPAHGPALALRVVAALAAGAVLCWQFAGLVAPDRRVALLGRLPLGLRRSVTRVRNG